MFRPFIILCATLVGIAAWAALGGEKPGPVGAPVPVPKPPRRVLITAELSRTHAYPGDSIRLTELVPVDREIQARSVSHTQHIIGEYDFATESLVNLNPENARFCSSGEGFDESGIDGSVGAVGDRPMPYMIVNPRQEGMEWDFKARQIGIYLIKAKWKLYGSKEIIESNPVILTVSPPLDKAGQPIIKEEWIDKTAWKYRPK